MNKSNLDLSNYLLKVEILPSSQVFERSGVSEKTQKEWLIRHQQAYIHLGKPYPSEFRLNLKEGQEPYKSGLYYIHPQSFKTNNYSDNLQLNDLLLIPVE
ncbi:Helix-destabilising protein [Phocoenobacter uteri]|uniref:Single-stranded DNA-binding protein n=1 Tax=Phocoenobacter uteri TaxID=146806 RepID=A0A379C958_9PAST|nr:single-stranded DNA-binding protein [Phocoenobacter uteri]MDG6882506.1 DNA-binding protein [Phocoenobacter uteri]SUB58668.1 Helix-destabilising protein [Phocoenobacter uteri]